MNTSGDRLRLLLRECHLSASDFAANRRVTPQHVNNWFKRGTYRELKAVRQSIAQQETREAQLKQVLQQAMGAATRVEFAEGYISWKKSKDSTGLDVERMLKDKPYLQARYSKLREGSRRFLIA